MQAPLLVDVARDTDDLRAILELQARNLPTALSPEEAQREGFVSLVHDVELLRDMGARWPHVVGRRAGRVVAYALVMPLELRARIPELEPMFEHLATAELDGRALANARWYVMGQVCVAKEERGKGWVRALYAEHKRRMAADFEFAVTEVDGANPRSLHAHRQTGWREVERYAAADGRRWVVLALNLGGPDVRY